MDGFVITGLPITAAVAAVALIGYIFGRRTRPESRDRADARVELRRARGVIRNLESIAQQVRRSLAQHHASVEEFRRRIDDLGEGGQTAAALAAEADRLMLPTEELAAQIARAYDEIRQQTTRLMDFASSRTDDVTGVSNRRALDDALHTQLAMQRRYHTTFSLCLLEIDEFAKLRSADSVQADELLARIAGALDENCRETDMVGRYGEDQFAVILPHTTLVGAAIFAERVRATLAMNSTVTLSGGITTALDGDNADTLLARLDEALYAARGHGLGQLYQHTGLEVRSAASHLTPAVAEAASVTVASGVLASGTVTAEAALAPQEQTDSWESPAAPAVPHGESHRPLQPR